ncbi:hypothetical protein ZHAS_00018543 [Anopheles sinensis]|uniref:Uncharacterized protein n=1 Tax=Anopheles sinensis TaxID=74873 RepID=A0A084WJW0_ANOSI|nr:hypothetical protein ZHAS_00018543 [Anopheles sinensis]
MPIEARNLFSSPCHTSVVDRESPARPGDDISTDGSLERGRGEETLTWTYMNARIRTEHRFFRGQLLRTHTYRHCFSTDRNRWGNKRKTHTSTKTRSGDADETLAILFFLPVGHTW